MSAEQTLLQLTQNVLSGLSSDEVNSITDTVESQQVATIIKNKYFDIVTRTALPKHNQLFQLTAANNVATPTLMYIPDNISNLEWLKYFDSTLTNGAATGYLYVTLLPFQQFTDMINAFNPSESNVGSFIFSDTSNNFNGNYTFYYRNDKQPNYCTVLSNYYVIFDSYDQTQDSTLQASKTMAFGEVEPAFTMADSFIPDLDPEQFPLLLNEAKALAYYELKQMPHAKAEQEIKRQWSNIQKDKSIDNKPSYFNQLANFGRKC